MKDQYKISHAAIEDIPILNVISYESKKYWNYPEEWIEKWKDDLTISIDDFSEMKIFKIECDEKIFGFCAVSEDEKHFEIEHLWISPRFIGKGFGKDLLQESLSFIDFETKDVIVTSDPNAEKFYFKMGFRTIDKIESYPNGRFLPVMKMQKNNFNNYSN